MSISGNSDRHYILFQLYSLEDLFPELINRDEMLAFETQARFFEIGSYSGLEEFKKYVLHLHRKEGKMVK